MVDVDVAEPGLRAEMSCDIPDDGCVNIGDMPAVVAIGTVGHAEKSHLAGERKSSCRIHAHDPPDRRDGHRLAAHFVGEPDCSSARTSVCLTSAMNPTLPRRLTMKSYS